MCHFSSYWGGGVPAIRDIIYCVFKTWKRGTRPLCSLQQESWKTFLDGGHAGLDAWCWWFISLLWSSWVLSSEHHLFFEISTRLLPDGLPLTLGAVLMCTDLRWCACTRSSCWLHELIHVTVVYANIKSNSSFNRPVKCWQLHWRVCYSVRCSYFVVPRVQFVLEILMDWLMVYALFINGSTF